MSGPSISVLMTVYNNAPYVAEAIESALDQTYTDIEVVVVDDGSDDGTGEIVKSFGSDVRYEYTPRGGIGVGRNRAIEISHGRFISVLDADDRYVPEKSELQLAVLAREPELEIVYGHVREFVSPELSESDKARVRAPIERVGGVFPGTMLGRREVFERVGGFSTTLRRAVGLDWQLRAAEVGIKVITLQEIVLERRLHLDNHGLREKGADVDYVRALKRSLDRKRALRLER